MIYKNSEFMGLPSHFIYEFIQYMNIYEGTKVPDVVKVPALASACCSLNYDFPALRQATRPVRYVIVFPNPTCPVNRQTKAELEN